MATPPIVLITVNRSKAYNGDISQSRPDIIPIENPNIMFGMFIIPLDMASGIGYVNSTANAFPTGAAGIPENPIKATFAANKPTFLEGNVI